MRGFLGVLIVVAAAGCSVQRTAFRCTDSASCQDGDRPGVCEPLGYCSFDDLGCAGTPRRYGAAAPDGIARRCVGDAVDAGVSDASLSDAGDAAGGDGAMSDGATVDARPIDAATIDGATTDAGATNCWSSIASGPEHNCAWKTDGTYYCWGNSMNGRLGARQPTAAGQPVLGAAPPTPGSLSLGDDFTCGVATDSDLWCAGGNGLGQLGDGSGTDRTTAFVKVRTSAAATLMGAQRIAAGYDHACAQISGTIYCWGNNDRGQLGSNPAVLGASSRFAVEVAGVTGARGLAAGNHHNCYITDSPSAGSVWCFGRGIEGQLGTTTPADSFTPVRAGTLTGITKLSLGWWGSCALNGSGEVYCWGKNLTGRFGTNDQMNKPTPTKMLGLTVTITEIAVGEDHICMVCTCNNVWCVGSNDAGRLGQPLATAMSLMPMQVPGLSNVVKISAGYHNNCVTRTNGQILCWGGNDSGEIGRDPAITTESQTPLLLGGVSCP